VVDGCEDGLLNAWPSLGDGFAVEAKDVALANAPAEVGRDALQDGDGGDGLEGSVGKAFLRIVIAALEEFLVFLLQVETRLGGVGFRHHDLKEREGAPAGVDAGKDVAGDINAVFRNLNDGEIVAGESCLAGVDFLSVIGGVGVEIGDTLGEHIMHGNGLGPFGRLWQHGILLAERVGGEVDANILVVNLLVIAGNAKALANGV